MIAALAASVRCAPKVYENLNDKDADNSGYQKVPGAGPVPMESGAAPAVFTPGYR